MPLELINPDLKIPFALSLSRDLPDWASTEAQPERNAGNKKAGLIIEHDGGKPYPVLRRVGPGNESLLA